MDDQYNIAERLGTRDNNCTLEKDYLRSEFKTRITSPGVRFLLIVYISPGS